MTSSLLATAVALSISLPIFALGERLRARQGRRLRNQLIPPNRKDTP